MEKSFSYWEQDSFLGDFDVLVVGGGLVGLMAAYQTKKQNKSLKIGILEAGFLPTGASTKNAGFACFGSVSELLDKLKTTPEADLLEVIDLRWKGLKLLREILGDAIIDYRPYGGFEIFKSDEKEFAENCIEQIGHFNSLLSPITGTADIYAPAKDQIAGWGFAGVNNMIENKLEGQLDTGKMMVALNRLVQQEGVFVFTNCRVNQINNKGIGQGLETNQGTLYSRRVIIATNAFTSALFPGLDVVPGRGQVLVTEPIPNLKFKGAFHYDCGYYYFRNIGERILLGGGRNLDFKAEETTEQGLTDVVQNQLEKLLSEVILPGQKPKIDYRWSGIMAFGEELKPLIAEVTPGVFSAVRCNGMGVAMGSQMGKLVAGLVLESL
ncbi:MAG: NAD(P)/FAD-dependent oxidoreductase [Sphingobacteriaceae bacterium]